MVCQHTQILFVPHRVRFRRRHTCWVSHGNKYQKSRGPSFEPWIRPNSWLLIRDLTASKHTNCDFLRKMLRGDRLKKNCLWTSNPEIWYFYVKLDGETFCPCVFFYFGISFWVNRQFSVYISNFFINFKRIEVSNKNNDSFQILAVFWTKL